MSKDLSHLCTACAGTGLSSVQKQPKPLTREEQMRSLTMARDYLAARCESDSASAIAIATDIERWAVTVEKLFREIQHIYAIAGSYSERAKSKW
jgi:hypothetical protein